MVKTSTPEPSASATDQIIQSVRDLVDVRRLRMGGSGRSAFSALGGFTRNAVAMELAKKYDALIPLGGVLSAVHKAR